MSKAELYEEYLRQEGFSPTVDGDGDVIFKFEGRTYILFGNEGDTQFFRLAFPNFWEIESDEEEHRVERAAMDVNKSMKVVKIHTAGKNTWVSVELLIDPPENFTGIFQRSLRMIREAVQEFRTRVTSSESNVQ